MVTLKLEIRLKFLHDKTDAPIFNKFEQILSQEALFADPIRQKELAKDFNSMTMKGERRDMSVVLYQNWARAILKKLIKPELFILVSGNGQNHSWSLLYYACYLM